MGEIDCELATGPPAKAPIGVTREEALVAPIRSEATQSTPNKTRRSEGHRPYAEYCALWSRTG